MKTISTLVVTMCVMISSLKAQTEFASQKDISIRRPNAVANFAGSETNRITNTNTAEGIFVDRRVLDAFNSTFPSVIDATWYEDDNKYTVHFTLHQIPVTAIYETEGNLIKIRRSYSKEHLALPLLMKLQKNYSGKEISGITEITDGSEIVYEIVLKDQYHWYKVIAHNSGSMDLVQKFRRGE